MMPTAKLAEAIETAAKVLVKNDPTYVWTGTDPQLTISIGFQADFIKLGFDSPRLPNTVFPCTMSIGLGYAQLAEEVENWLEESASQVLESSREEFKKRMDEIRTLSTVDEYTNLQDWKSTLSAIIGIANDVNRNFRPQGASAASVLLDAMEELREVRREYTTDYDHIGFQV